MAKKRTREVREADITQEMQEEEQSKEVQEETTVEDGHAFKYVQDYLNKDLEPLNKEDAAALLETMRKSDIMKPFFALMEEYPEEISVLMEFQGIPERIKRIPLANFVECVREAPKKEDITSAKLLKNILSCKLDADGYPANIEYRAIIENAEKYQVKTLTSNNFVMPNTNLWNTIVGRNGKKLNEDGTLLSVVYAEKNRQMQIADYLVITCNGENETANFSYTPTQEAFMCGIFTIYDFAKNNNTRATFTLESLCDNLPGCNSKNPKLQKELEEFLNKEMIRRVEINVTEYAKNKGILPEGLEAAFIGDYSLTLREFKIKDKGGHIKQAWEIKDIPPYLYHAYQRKQIITISRKHLKPTIMDENGKKKPLSMNDDRRAMLLYMARQVSIMKYDQTRAIKNHNYSVYRSKANGNEPKSTEKCKKYGETMLFETIFSKCGVRHKNRNDEKRDKDFCINVMFYWMDTGFIKSFEAPQEGRGGSIKRLIVKV